MSKSHTIRGYRNLKEATKGMTPKQKWEHYWTYYKAVTIAVIIGVILLGMFLYDILKPKAESILDGAAINVTLGDEAYSYVTEGILAPLGAEEGQIATVTYFHIADMSADHNAAYNYDEIMKLTAMIAAQSLDYLLMDEVARDYYLKAANLIDLSSVLTDTQLEAIRDRLVYQEQEDGSRIPLAVDLTGTAFAAQCVLADDSLYIGFPGNTGRNDQIYPLLECLINWE